MSIKLVCFNLFFYLSYAAVAQAQETTLPHICTEIILDADRETIPDLPPGMTARAVAFKPELGKYWPNGRVLKVRFLGGTEAQRSRVRKYAPEWSQVANVQFVFVEKGEADLRINFTPGLGTWSLIGTDASHLPQYQQTMNFGWFDSRTPERDYRATILHEFGHSLGLLHEHQHPTGGIPWDKAKLYQYYRQTQGWDKEQVDQQVLTRYNSNKTQYTRYDPASIMHYPIPNSLTVGDFEVGINFDLSSMDRAFIAKVYPKKATTGTVAGTSTRPTTSTPATTTAMLTIRDMLPASQKREQVWITVQGITKSFILDQTTAQAGRISFVLPKDGRYPYSVRTKTTFLKRVNGRLQETTLNGYGEGEVMVRRNATFDLAIGKSLNDRWFAVELLTAK